MQRTGRRRVFMSEPIATGRQNRCNLYIGVVVYARGSVRLRGFVRDSFDRRKRGRSMTLAPRNLNLEVVA